jgi:hypothetical protein
MLRIAPIRPLNISNIEHEKTYERGRYGDGERNDQSYRHVINIPLLGRRCIKLLRIASLESTYLMRWKVRFQRVWSKMWMRMWPMKLMRSPMLCLSIWSAGVLKDQ